MRRIFVTCRGLWRNQTIWVRVKYFRKQTKDRCSILTPARRPIQSNPLIARRCYLRLRRVIGQCPNKSKIATTHILHAEEGMMDIIIIIIIITIIIIIIIIIIIMMMIIIRFREAEEGIIGNFTFKFPPGWLLKPFHRIIPALIMSNIIMMVTMILTSRIMIMMIILMIRNGQFYHLPTFSNVVATGQDGLWMTEFKGGIISWSSW